MTKLEFLDKLNQVIENGINLPCKDCWIKTGTIWRVRKCWICSDKTGEQIDSRPDMLIFDC
jgi:hypothetical protein